MNPGLDLSKLTPIELRLQVEELLYAYADVLDNGLLDDWPPFFTSDCLYQIIARENYDRGLPLATMLCESQAMLRDRVTAYRQANVYSPRYFRHLISTVRIVGIESGIVSARSNFAVLQTLVDDETRVFLAGRYEDCIVIDEGRLRFRQKLCIYDTLHVPNSIVHPV